MNHFSFSHFLNMVSVSFLSLLHERERVSYDPFLLLPPLLLAFQAFYFSSFSLISYKILCDSSLFLLNSFSISSFDSSFLRDELNFLQLSLHTLFFTSSSSLLLSRFSPCHLMLLQLSFNNLTLISFTMFILVKDQILLRLHHFSPIRIILHGVIL